MHGVQPRHPVLSSLKRQPLVPLAGVARGGGGVQGPLTGALCAKQPVLDRFGHV